MVEDLAVSRRYPNRAFGRRYGAFDIDSMPPVTTSSWPPARIITSAIWIARTEDAHTLLIVSAGTSFGMPAPTAACRAGACPAPAWSTWPMITYSTSPGSTATRSSAARIASRSELRRRDVREATAEAAERRPNGGNDDRAGHSGQPTGRFAADGRRASTVTFGRSHFDEHLPDVLPAQQPEERARRVLDPVDDRLAVAEPTVSDPFLRALEELGKVRRSGR